MLCKQHVSVTMVIRQPPSANTPCSICGRGTQEAREAVPLTKEAWCPRGSGNLAAQSLWTLFATKHWVLGLQNTYSSTLSLHPSL